VRGGGRRDRAPCARVARGATKLIGTLDWARATGGNLTAAERRSLLAPVLRAMVAYSIGRLRLSLGLRPARLAELDLDSLRVPDSRLVREAETEGRATLSPVVLNHSYRTFAFGLALGRLDGIAVDVEHFYAACLLHDLALEKPHPGRCFAVVGAERVLRVAERAGVEPKVAQEIAEAVAMHITPGAGFECGPLAPLVAAGALVDLVGTRLEAIDPATVRGILARHPRTEFRDRFGEYWKREAAAVPRGRAALLERWARLSTFARWAPFPE
jgi:hypothetical protein